LLKEAKKVDFGQLFTLEYAKVDINLSEQPMYLMQNITGIFHG
jgi:hypothetical protein